MKDDAIAPKIFYLVLFFYFGTRGDITVGEMLEDYLRRNARGTAVSNYEVNWESGSESLEVIQWSCDLIIKLSQDVDKEREILFPINSLVLMG